MQVSLSAGCWDWSSGVCRKCVAGCSGAVGQVCSSAGHSVLVKHLKPMPFHFAYSVSSLVCS